MKLFKLLFLLASLSMVGCAAVKMTPATDQNIAAAPAGKSRVVFMRSSFVGSAIAASIYEVKSDEPNFIGVMNNGTKIIYDTAPGDHVFMVVSEAADYMEAKLEAGKTYYAMVTPRFGAWKARFSMWPVRKGSSGEFYTESDDFKGWVKNTKLVQNNDKTQQWFDANKADIKAKHAEYWPEWKTKTPAELKERTLLPEDGM